MRTQTQSRFYFLVATLLLLVTTTHSLIDPYSFSATTTTSPAATPPAAAVNPAPKTNNMVPTKEDMDFIRTSCASTEYPQDCFNSLSHYAAAVQQNPDKLVRVAIALSLSRVTHEATYFNNLTKEADYGADHRAAAALHDCFSVFGDAVDQLRGSLKQMRHLVSRSSESFQFQMSNIQTWMSAALTNEETCKDGFDGVPEGPMKSDVFDRVKRAEAVTVNALSLVNSFAVKVSTDFVNYP